MCVAKRAFGRLPQTATIRSLVCSCEMRPFAFLEPRAFFNTDPDFRAQIELNECVGLKSWVETGRTPSPWPHSQFFTFGHSAWRFSWRPLQMKTGPRSYGSKYGFVSCVNSTTESNLVSSVLRLS